MRAQIGLAFMTLKGGGLPESPTEAARLFQSAATHDDPTALYNIGLLRLSGKGVAKDLDRAETALRKAVRKDYLPVIQALAISIRAEPMPSSICGRRRFGMRRRPSGAMCRRNSS